MYDIMTEYNIVPSERDHNIPPDASFEHVLQYTEWHMGYLNRRRRHSNARQHYRYDRYRSLLELIAISADEQAHVDLGCGAGVFSWAFLDWMTEHGIANSRVSLYGYDHCREMIRLSYMVRGRISRTIADYPELYYFQDIKSLTNRLELSSENSSRLINHTITFGHVLAQAHSPDAIQAYTKIISTIVDLMDPRSTCLIGAVDASGHFSEFLRGWKLLIESLISCGMSLNSIQDKGADAQIALINPPVP